MLLLPPGAAPCTGAPPSFNSAELCDAAIDLGLCDVTTSIAAAGAFTRVIGTDGGSGMPATLLATAR